MYHVVHDSMGHMVLLCELGLGTQVGVGTRVGNKACGSCNEESPQGTRLSWPARAGE